MRQRWSNSAKFWLVLIGTSLLATSLVVARVFYTGRITFVFLLWNLFLAWLPVLFAGVAERSRQTPVGVGFGLLWLLFLPNAPYLVTDLMHLRPFPAIPLWYDALMLFTFALTGLLLGLHSLAMMQNLVSGRYGDTIGWLFALLTMSLSSFGVYIGRFLRWNSWDLLANPVSLLSDVAQHLSQPQLTLRTAVLSLSLNALLLFVYTLLYTRSTQMVVRHPG